MIDYQNNQANSESILASLAVKFKSYKLAKGLRAILNPLIKLIFFTNLFAGHVCHFPPGWRRKDEVVPHWNILNDDGNDYDDDNGDGDADGDADGDDGDGDDRG